MCALRKTLSQEKLPRKDMAGFISKVQKMLGKEKTTGSADLFEKPDPRPNSCVGFGREYN